MFGKWTDVRLDFSSVGEATMEPKLWCSVLTKLNELKIKNLILVNYKKETVIMNKIKELGFNYRIEKVVNIDEIINGKKFNIITLRISREDLNKNIKHKLLENKNKYNGLIIDIANSCMPYHSTYWKEREIRFEKESFNINDINLLKDLSTFLKSNRDELKIMNSNQYLDYIKTFGVLQNWRCKHFNLPTIKSDGSIWICKQKPFYKQFSIFELNNRNDDTILLNIFMQTNQLCDGCFQQDKCEGFIDG